jgi:hypothetical protein
MLVTAESLIYDAQRPRFAAPHAQRSELKASVNNALLGADFRKVCVSSIDGRDKAYPKSESNHQDLAMLNAQIVLLRE